MRTVAQGEARFNPMSYHNGSVWPHDNALIAMGFSRYGLKHAAAALLDALFDTAVYQEARRLPELFCGFTRTRHRGPTAYPVACVPQAWAAATPFALLSASLGLDLSFADNEVRFTKPVLPRFLDEVVLRNLRLGTSRMDVRLHRFGSDVHRERPLAERRREPRPALLNICGRRPNLPSRPHPESLVHQSRLSPNPLILRA